MPVRLVAVTELVALADRAALSAYAADDTFTSFRKVPVLTACAITLVGSSPADICVVAMLPVRLAAMPALSAYIADDTFTSFR